MPGYKRKRNGDSWLLEVTLGADFTGKRKRYTKTVHCKNEREAEKELQRFYVECEDGNVSASRTTTVADLCDIYFEKSVKRHQKRNSQMSTKTAIKIWIKPYLGKRKLNKLKKHDIQEWVDMLEDKDKAPKTIRNQFSILRSMFNYAIDDLEVMDSNPCDRVKLPSLDTNKKVKSYKKDEVKLMLDALNKLPDSDQAYKCFVLLSLFGGFRKGEIMGFYWDDIDFEEHTISVVRTRYYDREKGSFADTPKSESSSRTIALPDVVMSDLKKLQNEQRKDKLKFGQHYQDAQEIIRDKDGSAMTTQRPYRWFGEFCLANNLPAYGLHALRHTHASLLASLGSNKVDVSTRLGHSKISTTLNIYTHLFEETEKTIADQLDVFAKEG